MITELMTYLRKMFKKLDLTHSKEKVWQKEKKFTNSKDYITVKRTRKM